MEWLQAQTEAPAGKAGGLWFVVADLREFWE